MAIGGVPICLLHGKVLTGDYRDEFCHHEEGTANHGPPSNTEKSCHDLTEYVWAFFADGLRIGTDGCGRTTWL